MAAVLKKRALAEFSQTVQASTIFYFLLQRIIVANFRSPHRKYL